VIGFNSPSQCAGGGYLPNTAANPIAGTVVPAFIPQLGCYDLTRPTPAAADACPSATATSYIYDVHASHQAGCALRARHAHHKQLDAESRRARRLLQRHKHIEPDPNLALAWLIRLSRQAPCCAFPTGTCSKLPFNENLILASLGCQNAVINEINTVTLTTPGSPYVCHTAPLSPSIRNEYHAGFEQAFGKYFVLDAEYIWKYTHLAYDFSVLGNTPIAFPIEWQKSKIPGYTIRGSLPNFHGLHRLRRGRSCRGSLLQPAGRRHWFCACRANRRGIPHRPRRKFRTDHPRPISAVEARTLVRFHLAV
jgi:hypothetical protein